MLVGYMEESKQPNELATLIAMSCSQFGLDFLYFTVEDINLQKEKISGLKYKNHEWVSASSEIPNFVDINPNLLNYYEEINYLQKRTLLSHDSEAVSVQKMFKEEIKTDKRYLALKEQFQVKDDLLFQMGERMISQTYPLTKDGKRYKIRVHFERNKAGKIAICSIYVIVYLAQLSKEISESAVGVSDIKLYLKANFQEPNRILTEIKKFGKLISEILSNYKTINFAVDLGVTQTEGLFIIGLDPTPDSNPIKFEVSQSRVSYYEFIRKLLKIENKGTPSFGEHSIFLNKLSDLKNDIHALNQKRNNIKSSFSWKITEPLRRVSKKLKR